MKRAFELKDDKSNKFWWIACEGDEFVANWGKRGTDGRYEIKEFDDAQTCQKNALALIRQKIKKGYVECIDFDYINHKYFDTEEVGLHAMTSHPHFRNYFSDESYYDCADEEAPFGSDEGSDTLASISEYVRKNPNFNFAAYPKTLIEEEWGLKYIPVTDLNETSVKEHYHSDAMNIMQSDMVTYATAFAEIKITGFIDKDLKEAALNALKRFTICSKLEYGAECHFSMKMINDLEQFTYFKA